MKNKLKIDKELILYGIVGIITTLIHILLFYVLNIVLSYKIANIITLILIKILAYVLNKKFVFKSRCKDGVELTKEIIKYIFSRFFTMIIDYVGLILLVEVFGFEELIGKIIVLFVVIILNYILSKKYVFKN
ncbi:MAG: GtrA family protein [Bacilli bacterium]|nr:GtrA family protein [Bacilli bacterium]